jgi:protein-L-isoaspartate(D-aspartate) O-methyltransferase
MSNAYAEAKNMISMQLVLRGIHDKRLLSVMEKIPREEFVPEEFRSFAYGDYPLPIGENQTISQPYIVAQMTELLSLNGKESVLELGTGSGYQTAILASLAKEIYTIERIPDLSLRACDTLLRLGFSNIQFKVGDGTLGWEEYAPYDRILVTAAGSILPPPLFQQLAEGGLIVMPIGTRFVQTLNIITKKNGGLKKSACTIRRISFMFYRIPVNLIPEKRYLAYINQN